jgi:hypothetical protein
VAVAAAEADADVDVDADTHADAHARAYADDAAADVNAAVTDAVKRQRSERQWGSVELKGGQEEATREKAKRDEANLRKSLESGGARTQLRKIYGSLVNRELRR